MMYHQKLNNACIVYTKYKLIKTDRSSILYEKINIFHTFENRSLTRGSNIEIKIENIRTKVFRWR